MYRRRLLAVLTTAAVAVPLVSTPAAATSAAPPVRDRLLARLLEAQHTAGMPGVFAQVRDGSDTWSGAAGVADVRTARPAKPWSRHRVGSITKTFVATTVLQLVGERRLRLDAPIGTYLPDVLPGALGGQVTVRMLLNHTSGIGNYTDPLLATAEDLVTVANRTFTPQQLVTIGLAMPVTGAPGARFAYSNTGYIILGLLIERLTGRPYATEVSRRILRPLGLRDTTFPGTDPPIRGPHLGAYVPWDNGTLRDFSEYNMSWAWAAGELISTASDLNRFYRALLTGRLLRADLLAQMKTTVPFEPTVPDAGGYGLGLFSTPTPCGLVWGHTGGVIGHTTFSLHSEDGRRQVTQGESLILYSAPGEPHPIDEARDEFLVAALCGDADVLATAGTGLRLPALPELAVRR